MAVIYDISAYQQKKLDQEFSLATAEANTIMTSYQYNECTAVIENVRNKTSHDPSDDNIVNRLAPIFNLQISESDSANLTSSIRSTLLKKLTFTLTDGVMFFKDECKRFEWQRNIVAVIHWQIAVALCKRSIGVTM